MKRPEDRYAWLKVRQRWNDQRAVAHDMGRAVREFEDRANAEVAWSRWSTHGYRAGGHVPTDAEVQLATVTR